MLIIPNTSSPASAVQQARGVISCTEAGDACSGRIKITYLRWIGGSTAGHQCLLRQYSDGDVAAPTSASIIWHSYADGDYFIDLFPIYQWHDGFYVHVLSSGTLYVYYE